MMDEPSTQLTMTPIRTPSVSSPEEAAVGLAAAVVAVGFGGVAGGISSVQFSWQLFEVRQLVQSAMAVKSWMNPTIRQYLHRNYEVQRKKRL